MDGHDWEYIVESDIAINSNYPKTQVLWQCRRCLQSTILEKGIDPELTKELYPTETVESERALIVHPEILSCSLEIIKSIITS